MIQQWREDWHSSTAGETSAQFPFGVVQLNSIGNGTVYNDPADPGDPLSPVFGYAGLRCVLAVAAAATVAGVVAAAAAVVAVHRVGDAFRGPLSSDGPGFRMRLRRHRLGGSGLLLATLNLQPARWWRGGGAVAG